MDLDVIQRKPASPCGMQWQNGSAYGILCILWNHQRLGTVIACSELKRSLTGIDQRYACSSSGSFFSYNLQP